MCLVIKKKKYKKDKENNEHAQSCYGEEHREYEHIQIFFRKNNYWNNYWTKLRYITLCIICYYVLQLNSKFKHLTIFSKKKKV